MGVIYPETLLDLLASFFVAGGGSTEVSDAATRALEAGLDSPTLRILAGLSEWTSPSELESMIERVLRELGLPMPNRSVLLRAMARPLAIEFLAGRITAGAFANHLYSLSRRDTHDGHHPWCQLQDEWELARDGTWSTVEKAVNHLREEAERILCSHS